MDGSHIRIENPPSDDRDPYINRKGFPSLNIQVLFLDTANNIFCSNVSINHSFVKNKGKTFIHMPKFSMKKWLMTHKTRICTTGDHGDILQKVFCLLFPFILFFSVFIFFTYRPMFLENFDMGKNC